MYKVKEPMCKVKESWAMIIAQGIYLSRRNLRLWRSVSVQRRAEKPPEPDRPAPIRPSGLEDVG